MKVFFDRMQETGDRHLEIGPQEGWDWDAVLSWVNGQFTKVCVGVETEDELIAIYQTAWISGLPCSLIYDSGLTEFGGVSTATAVAIGPAPAEKIDPITGALKLL